jgi:hypothetical protein
LLPTAEKSKLNPDAPLLSEEDVTQFELIPELQNNLRWACSRFLGLKVDGNKVVKGGRRVRRGRPFVSQVTIEDA